ncbi:MAG: hypothetical protein IOC86_14310 [Aestuariivirga sp.]|nr:hypothetical protein [Aestuariivirga sp.]
MMRIEQTGQTRRVIERLVTRYPDKAQEIRQAALGDHTFRDVCDDLAIALETLARFEARTDASSCPEIPEYKAIILELEAEIGAMILQRSGSAGA